MTALKRRASWRARSRRSRSPRGCRVILALSALPEGGFGGMLSIRVAGGEASAMLRQSRKSGGHCGRPSDGIIGLGDTGKLQP